MAVKQRGGPVYSSEHGRMCPFCGHSLSGCVCRRPDAIPRNDGYVRVRREKRAGKVLTVIMGVPLAATALAELASELKRKLSAGGSAKDGNIEVQGDHRDRIVALLQERGWKVKLAGG